MQPEQEHAPRCPFCGSADTELLSLFGSQLLTEQRYCRACRTPFEAIARDRAPATAPQPPSPPCAAPDDHA
jgi:ring-1,2-phenylacetyl-CoA epoxidase subunit PaaD